MTTDTTPQGIVFHMGNSYILIERDNGYRGYGTMNYIKKLWITNNFLHRTDGPAVVYREGDYQLNLIWYLEGYHKPALKVIRYFNERGMDMSDLSDTDCLAFALEMGQ